MQATPATNFLHEGGRKRRLLLCTLCLAVWRGQCWQLAATTMQQGDQTMECSGKEQQMQIVCVRGASTGGAVVGERRHEGGRAGLGRATAARAVAAAGTSPAPRRAGWW